MARRNPQETVAALRDELAEKEEYIDDLEDKVDRLTGRLARVQAIADVEDIVDGDDDDEDADGEDDSEDEDEDEDDDDDE